MKFSNCRPSCNVYIIFGLKLIFFIMPKKWSCNDQSIGKYTNKIDYKV